jgi:hypothetical protein
MANILNINSLQIMIRKEYNPKRTQCKVTFALPVNMVHHDASVVGEFNEWNTNANKFERKNGRWEATVRLTPGNHMRFRYLVDGNHWANDEQADGYVANEFGTEDSVLKIE